MNLIRKTILCTMSAAVLANTAMPMPVCGAEAAPKLIALTFDDGPNTTTTNEVLDLLEAYGAVASFFLIGTNINEESAKTVKRAYDMGCEIDNHSKTHSYMSDMSAEELANEVGYVDNYVYEITGEHTKFFRPPFIAVSQSMYDCIELPFICGLGCDDFMENVTAEQRAETVISGAKDGLIVLMHDAAGNSQTVEALKTIIPTLQAEGYEFVTLTELFARQGETPKRNLLYSEVAKYPCDGYALYQNLTSAQSDQIDLDGAVLQQLGDSYAIEVNYSDSQIPPVIALQKWSDGESVWQALQPFYYNGERACFLASEIGAAIAALGKSYTDFDRISITKYGDSITLSDAKILVASETPPAETLPGDVNDDGKVNLADAVMLHKYLLSPGSMPNPKSADLNNDHTLNTKDLTLLKRILLT